MRFTKFTLAFKLRIVIVTENHQRVIDLTLLIDNSRDYNSRLVWKYLVPSLFYRNMKWQSHKSPLFTPINRFQISHQLPTYLLRDSTIQSLILYTVDAKLLNCHRINWPIENEMIINNFEAFEWSKLDQLAVEMSLNASRLIIQCTDYCTKLALPRTLHQQKPDYNFDVNNMICSLTLSVISLRY
jgi:hypothetical protein